MATQPCSFYLYIAPRMHDVQTLPLPDASLSTSCVVLFVPWERRALASRNGCSRSLDRWAFLYVSCILFFGTTPFIVMVVALPQTFLMLESSSLNLLLRFGLKQWIKNANPLRAHQ